MYVNVVKVPIPKKKLWGFSSSIFISPPLDDIAIYLYRFGIAYQTAQIGRRRFANRATWSSVLQSPGFRPKSRSLYNGGINRGPPYKWRWKYIMGNWGEMSPRHQWSYKPSFITTWGPPCRIIKIFNWLFLDGVCLFTCWFFMDSTMVNHHFSIPIGEYVFP